MSGDTKQTKNSGISHEQKTRRDHLGALVGLMNPVKSFASVGTDGASFLDIPVGAGPAALGSAYTALATNAYAPVWNPAGLGMLTGNEVAAQHLSYLESMHYEYMSFVHPLDKGVGSDIHRGVGFSVQYLGSGDIAGTDNTGASIGNFSSSYASYNLSYGQTVTDKLAIGVTGKTIRASIDDVSAAAYAADVAGIYKVNEKTQFAASAVNMGTQLKFISEGDSLPMAFKFGGAYKPSSNYLVSAEGVYSNGLASFHTGAEWRPLEAVSIRLGYKTDTLKGLSPDCRRYRRFGPTCVGPGIRLCMGALRRFGRCAVFLASHPLWGRRRTET